MNNTYQQTINWLFSQLPMFQNKGIKAFRPKLQNIENLCQHLNNPHKNFPCIHIAGTNGKGSSSHAIASVLQEAGYKVGLYTSPHLKDFRERIKINGQEIDKNFVVHFVEKHKSFFQQNNLSFFEMTVGMAFSYFENQQIDIAVIEVGLGGRFDSTNIISPEVSLITNIGKDHTDILGDTLAKIAFEKAGIIKPKTPVVISEFHSETFPVFQEEARKNNSPLIQGFSLSPTYKMDLLGQYQQKNIKGIVATLQVLQEKGWKISEEHIKNGLLHIVKNTQLKGRWQILSQSPKIICDTGHNTHGISEVIAQLQNEKYEKLHIVLGFVKEKNIDDILPMFPKNATYYLCKPNIERGLDPHILKEKTDKLGFKSTIFLSVQHALENAKIHAQPNDVIFIGGSTFVVAEIV